MGRAIVIKNVDWSDVNLGQVTVMSGLWIEGPKRIDDTTEYVLLYEGEVVSGTWSVLGDATISASSGGVISVTPLSAGYITLVATYTDDGTTYSTSYIVKSTLPQLEVAPRVMTIREETEFSATYDGAIDDDVVWTIDDDTIATLTDNGDGTCSVVPLSEYNEEYVTITATSSNGVASVSFIPCVGVLPEGYEQMAYVQTHASSNQYIDTGITPTNKTKIYIDYSFIHSSSNNNYRYIFDDNNVHKFSLNGVSNGLNFQGLTTEFTFSGISWARHTLELDEDGIVWDGVEYPATNEEKETWTSSAHLWLFGGKYSSTNRLSASRIYRCRLYDDGVLVRNYIPCKRLSDGTLGLYDIVNDAFYTTASGIMHGKVDFTPNYVTNGLVGIFDGYNAGNGFWAANGLGQVALQSGYSKTSDSMGVVFNGDGCTGNGSYQLSYGTNTIEVVYKMDSVPTSNQVIFKGYHATSGSKGNMAFWIDGDGYVRNDFYTKRDANNLITPYVGKVITQSVTSLLNYINGMSLGKCETTSSSIPSPGSTGDICIADAYWSNTHHWELTGTIYQIRVYSRELTAEEILHNQEIDIELYGINE